MSHAGHPDAQHQTAVDAALADPSMELAEIVLHMAVDVQHLAREVAVQRGQPATVEVGLDVVVEAARRRALTAPEADRVRSLDHVVALAVARDRRAR